MKFKKSSRLRRRSRRTRPRGVLAASPAQAYSYGMNYPSHANCIGGTAASFGNYVAQGYKVTIKEHCVYHKIGKNPAFWFSLIEYNK